MGEGKLTAKQRALLTDVSTVSHICGEQTEHSYRTAASLERRGLITTDRCGEWFDCVITEAGRSALSEGEKS